MKTIYLRIITAFAKRKSIKLVAVAFVFLTGVMPLKSFATDFPNETWTSVIPSSHCPGKLSNYTLKANVENTTGANIGLNATVTITFPAGFGLGSITGGTFNGSNIAAFTTTATTISFYVSAGGQVGIGKSFTIFLSGIKNIDIPGNYQISMTIANASGGTDTWAATVNSEFVIYTPSTPPVKASVDVNGFCSGTPGNISLSVTGGTLETGAVATWYAGACGGNLVGTGNPLIIPKPITTTTYFVRYEGCSNTTCVFIKVRVNALPTISGTLTVCPGSTTQLTGSTTPATPPDATTPWASSNTGVATVSTTGLVTGVSPGTSVITYKNSNGCTTTATVTVNGLPGITTSGTVTAVCFSAAAQTTTLSYTATTNSPTSYSIDWDATANIAGLADQGNTAFTFLAGGGTLTGITITAGTPAGTYSGIMTITNGNTCTDTRAVTVKVNTSPAIITTGTMAPVCFSAAAQTTTLVYTATTNSPTSYSIVWTGLANQGSTAFAFAAGGGTLTGITIPAGTAAGTYTGTMTINAGSCTGTHAVSVTVNAPPTISGTLTVCPGSTTSLTGSGTPDATTPWASATTTVATVNSSGVVTGVSAGTSVITYKNSNGCSATATVTVNGLPGITTSGTVTAVCFSAAAQTTSLPYTATTNSPTSYSIDWNATANAAGLADQGSTAFTFLAGGGTLTGINITAGTPAGTYSGIMTITNGNTCTNTRAIAVKINASPAISTTGTMAPVCLSAGAQTTTLAYTATTNNPTSYSIVWTGLANQGSTAFAFAAGSGTLTGITIPAGTPAGTYTGTMTINAGSCKGTHAVSVTVNAPPTISGTLTVCPGSTTSLTGSGTPDATTPWASATTTVATVNSSGVVTGVAAGTSVITYKNSNGCTTTATVTVNGLPGITTSGTVTAVCFSAAAQTTSLTYTATSNSPTSYSIDWNATANAAGLADQGSTAFTFLAGGGTLTGINITAGTPAGTYSGTMTITNGNTCTNSRAVTVKVNASPAISTTGTMASVCFSAAAQTTTLVYTATTNSPTSYSIVWTGMANQGNTIFAFAAGGGTLTGIKIPAGTAAGTYTGTMTINAGSCKGTHAVSVTVNAPPTISGTLTVCPGSTTSLTGSGTPDATTPWASATTTVATVNSSGVVTGVAPGTSVITYKNSNGCTTTATVIVNGLPGITTSGTLTAVCFSAAAQTTSLPYTATSNSPTSYSIDWNATANAAGLADQGNTAFTFLAGGGTLTGINITAGTPAGTYSGTMTITNGNTCTNTGAVTVTVNTPNAAGTLFETSATICAGGNDTLTETGGSLGTNAHWQWYTDPSFTSPIGGPLTTTDASLIVSPATTTTYYLRAEGAASCGNVISGSITVNVDIPATISAHPTDATTCIGTDVVFSVNALGTAFTRQWQVSTDNGLTFINISDGVLYSGTTTTSLTVKAPGFTMNGYQYRVVLTNNSACIAILPSNPATLTTRNTWTGKISSDWKNANNWTNNVLPSPSCNTVGIPAGTPSTPQLTSDDVILTNLGIAPGANLDLNGHTLEIDGTFTGSSTGYLKGSISSGLVLGGSAGSLYFDPNNNYLKNLTLNGSSTATVGNDLNITAGTYASPGTLTVNGIAALDANDNLTIKSDINGDARIAQSTGKINGNVTVERFIPARRAWRYLAIPFSSSSQTIRDAWQEGVNNYGLDPASRLNPNPGFGTHITGNNNSALGFDFNNEFPLNPSLKVWNGATNDFDVNEPPTISTNIVSAARDAYVIFVRGSRAVDLSLGTEAPADNTVLRIKGNLNEKGSNISRTYSGISGGFVLAGNPFASSINMQNILNGTRGSGFGLNKIWVWDPKIGGTSGVGAYVTWTSGVWAPNTGSYPGNNGTLPIVQSGQAFLVQLNTGSTSASITFSQSDKASSEGNVTGRGTNNAKSAYPNPVVYANLVSTFGDSLSLLDGVAAVFNNVLWKKADALNALKKWNYYENMSLLRNGQHFAIEFRPLSTADTLFFGLDLRKNQPYALQIFSQSIPDSTKGKAWLIDKYLKLQKPVNLSDTTVYGFTPTADSNSYRNRFMLVFNNHQQSLVDKTITLTGDSRNVGVFPNPVTGHSFMIQLSNFKAGKYEALIYNSKGTLILTKELQHKGNNAGYKVMLPSTIPQGVYNLVLKKDNLIVKTVSLLIAD